MSTVYLITGAGSGFGALAARALAKAKTSKNIVYAGMYSHTGDHSQHETDAHSFAKEHNVDLRTVPLNLLDQNSCNSAVEHVVKDAGKLDTIIHNAGHMNYGPGEAFTPEQYLSLYDINVVGAHRLNIAALPHMRQRRSGHLIWISSTSVYGAKSPWLGGYFAAKAGMDSLAQSYARELNPWGIETTIVSPGAFTSGTNHFTNAMQPGRKEVAEEYETGPTNGVSQQNLEGTASTVEQGADVSMVADVLVDLAAIPRGKKPYRMTADATDCGHDVTAALVDKFGADYFKRLGLEKLLKVTL